MAWSWVGTEYSTYWVHHTPSTAYTQYSIHLVQHTPSTAYTKYRIQWVQHPAKIVCLPFILIITSWPLNTASDTSMTPYTIDCHQPVLHENPMAMSPCHIPTVGSYLTDDWSLSSWHAMHQPHSSTHPISLNQVLLVHIQTCSIVAFKCISKLTELQLPSASPNLLDHGNQVYLESSSITACTFALSRISSTSPHLLDYGIQVDRIMTSMFSSILLRLRHPSAYLQTCPMTASVWISKSAQSQSPSGSPSSLDHTFPVYVQLCSIIASRCNSTLAHLQPRSFSRCTLNYHFPVFLGFLSYTTCSQFRYTV